MWLLFRYFMDDMLWSCALIRVAVAAGITNRPDLAASVL